MFYGDPPGFLNYRLSRGDLPVRRVQHTVGHEADKRNLKHSVRTPSVSHNYASRQRNNEKLPEAGIVFSKQGVCRTVTRLENFKMYLNEIDSEGID
jgi:hypothetical protein